LSVPLLPAGAILLLLREMGIFLGGADEVRDIVEMVLTVSAAMEGDRNGDTGHVIDCAATAGDFKGLMGCIGSCTCCTG
jgi:hypothetical protein